MQIDFVNPFTQKPLIKSNEGLMEGNTVVFPFENGAYRIVADNNYTANFGFQWNKFAATQIDKTTNLNISKERFFIETGWKREELENKSILEVGSGAGRFTQIILDFTNANLYSVDYSNAVEANYKNNGPHSRLNLFQASIYEMPFAQGQFDKVFCFGVLQHTPDVERSVRSLIDMVKPGGELVVDFYPLKGWWTKLHAKYVLRPFTKKMDHQKLLQKIENNADRLIGMYKFFQKIGVGKVVNRFLPVCGISQLPDKLSKEELREWVILDTFDMYSPEYDNPQSIDTVKKWFEEFGMKVTFAGMMTYANDVEVAVVKGIKK